MLQTQLRFSLAHFDVFITKYIKTVLDIYAKSTQKRVKQ